MSGRARVYIVELSTQLLTGKAYCALIGHVDEKREFRVDK